MKLKSSKNKAGRHKDEDMDVSFQLLCSWLEGQAEVFTLPEMQEKMKTFSETGEAYSVPWLEKKLQMKYKDLIYFSRGMPTKVCFRDMANYILSDAWYNDRKDNTLEDDESARSDDVIKNNFLAKNVNCKWYYFTAKFHDVRLCHS